MPTRKQGKHKMTDEELQALLLLIENKLDLPHGIHYIYGYVKQKVEINKAALENRPAKTCQELDQYHCWDSNVNYPGYEGL